MGCANSCAASKEEVSSAWDVLGGSEFRVALAFHKKLGGCPVRLVDARFLINLASEGGRLSHRQALPEAAFLSLATLAAMDRGPCGALRVVVVSYPWLQPDHPDPHGTTLQLLARVLKAYVESPWGGTCGVFLDFCSLHQKGPCGEARSASEAKLFGFALGNLSDWYSHPMTVVLKLTKMPAGYPDGFSFAAGTTPNTADYYGRGWCFKESSVANLVKNSYLCLDLGKLDLGKLDDAPSDEMVVSVPGMKAASSDWDGIETQCRAGRAAPLTPEDFLAELERKSFTSKKADLPTVGALYKAAFTKRFGEATALFYSGLQWGDSDLVLLSKVLGSGALTNLSDLHLSGNQIGDAGLTALADSLSNGAVQIRNLDLFGNQVGDPGVSALADACARGALAPGAAVFLDNNNVTQAGKQAARDATKDCDRTVCWYF